MGFSHMLKESKRVETKLLLFLAINFYEEDGIIVFQHLVTIRINNPSLAAQIFVVRIDVMNPVRSRPLRKLFIK